MLDTTNLLWYGSIAVELLFCLHLIWTKLARTYPVFTVTLGYAVARDLAAIYFMRGAIGPKLPLLHVLLALVRAVLAAASDCARVGSAHKNVERPSRCIAANAASVGVCCS